MFDFIKYIKALFSNNQRSYIEYKEVNLGTVESSTSHSFVIRRDTFAPGLWVGLNNSLVQVVSGDYKFEICVNFINLNKAHVYYLGPTIKPNDEIYLPSIRIEDGR